MAVDPTIGACQPVWAQTIESGRIWNPDPAHSDEAEQSGVRPLPASSGIQNSNIGLHKSEVRAIILGDGEFGRWSPANLNRPDTTPDRSADFLFFRPQLIEKSGFGKINERK